MALFTREYTLPQNLAKELVETHLKPIYSLPQEAGDWLVITPAGLLKMNAESREKHLWPWTDIDNAVSDVATRVITVNFLTGEPALQIEVPDRKTKFPVELRDRIQSSLVYYEEFIEPKTGKKFKVAIRREHSGEMFSQLITTTQFDTSDPEIDAFLTSAENQVLSVVGIEQ